MTHDEMNDHDEVFRAEAEAKSTAKNRRRAPQTAQTNAAPDHWSAADQAVWQQAATAFGALMQVESKYEPERELPASTPVAPELQLPQDYRPEDSDKSARYARRLALAITAELVTCAFIDPTESEFDETVIDAMSVILGVLDAHHGYQFDQVSEH